MAYYSDIQGVVCHVSRLLGCDERIRGRHPASRDKAAACTALYATIWPGGIPSYQFGSFRRFWGKCGAFGRIFLAHITAERRYRPMMVHSSR